MYYALRRRSTPLSVLKAYPPLSALQLAPSVHLPDDGEDAGSRVLPGLAEVDTGIRADVEVVGPDPYLE